jgi:solute:Na+ symporter, SSS family
MEPSSEILAATNFTGLDWGIVAVYLALSVAIGIIANRYVADMADYVVAGRGIRTALGVATLTGTELGLVTVMYSAQKGFTGGFAAFHIGLAAGVVTLFVGMTGFIVVGLRRHKVLTIPEFYGIRFGTSARVLGGVLLAAGGILNMGMFLNAGAKFIVGITGLPLESGALTIVMLVLLALVVFYTVMGGMVSVVLTDYVQFVVLSFGLLLATVLAIVKLGWSNIFDSMVEHKGAGGFNPFVSEAFGPDYVMWMLFLGLVGCALWPTSVARALACESEAVVKKQFMLSSLSYAIRNIVPYFWGICAFVFIMQTGLLKDAFFPADGAAGGVDSLYAMPIFLGRVLPAGLIGLITAAMIAAFMSTHDSYFLCWSSVITNDIITPLAGGDLPQRTQVNLARLMIVLIGIVIFVVSYVYPLGQDLWDFMAVTGAIYFTGAFAVLVAGLYWKGASTTGAIAAMVAGSTAVLGLVPIQKLVLVKVFGCSEAVLEALTGARVGLGSVVLAVVAMIAGSLLFPDKKRASEPAG